MYDSDAWGTKLTEGAMTLTVTHQLPDGHVAVCTLNRKAPTAPFSPEDVERAVHDFAAALAECDVAPGSTDSLRRLPLRGWNLRVQTGPPTWWWPRVSVGRNHVMVGWLRGLVALQRRTRY